jgi:hypothetical protein
MLVTWLYSLAWSFQWWESWNSHLSKHGVILPSDGWAKSLQKGSNGRPKLGSILDVNGAQFETAPEHHIQVVSVQS